MIRVRYRATELSEGVVELLPGDKIHVLDDNTVEFYELNEKDKWAKVGWVHPERWDSVCLAEETETTEA